MPRRRRDRARTRAGPGAGGAGPSTGRASLRARVTRAASWSGVSWSVCSSATELVDVRDERGVVHGMPFRIRGAGASSEATAAGYGASRATRVRPRRGRLAAMAAARRLRFGTPAARWVIAATVLGSGIAFLDGTIVNVALPAIGRDLKTDVAGLQWTVDAYLVTLTAFLLFGGALGDRFGRRRMFVTGLVSFTVASVACAAAPDATVLAIARAVQGAAGALLVPGQPRDHRLVVPRRGPRPRDRRVVGPRRHRERGRPVRRRLVDRHVLVAVGVPRQRPARDRRGRDHRAPRARVARATAAAARRLGRGARRGRARDVVLGADRERSRLRRARSSCRALLGVGAIAAFLVRREPELASDAAAAAVPEPAVQRRQRHDARGVRARSAPRCSWSCSSCSSRWATRRSRRARRSCR